ncbi:inosine/xanthosine triphosphatase [Haloferacaceae archaeon DSL9]
MRVGVGSGNPVKRRAVEQALGEEVDGEASPAVAAVPVESGVPEQPVGHDETLAGATNRARRVVDAGYDLGVGLEGGVATFDGAEGLFLVMWAVATDGDRVGRGAGPSLELPERVASRIRAGEELGPVMDDLLGIDGVARKNGAAGVLTGDRVDRTDALAAAAAGALGPFVCEMYNP